MSPARAGKSAVILSLLALLAVAFLARFVPSSPNTTEALGHFEDSWVIAPHYVAYLSDSEARFAAQAAALRQRLGSSPHVLVGFAASLPMEFPAIDLNQPLTETQMARTLAAIDRIVERAARQKLIVHITLSTGFFHGMNDLRPAAIQQDVRNAQWFADGWIGDPALVGQLVTAPNDARAMQGIWTTPSRRAVLLRSRMEEGVRVVGRHLAAQLAAHPETLVSISGDGEVELNFERNISGGDKLTGRAPIVADYSPFMVEEFRDWIRHSKYAGDRSPDSDDDHDGHTLNGDFQTSFTDWRLRYFDGSGPIPLTAYLKLEEKLPSHGPYYLEGGFDAPRSPLPGNAFWELWQQFRRQAVANYVHDFASWLQLPAAHYFSHQIPADFLFGDKDSLRLLTSASTAQTAFIAPLGSTGITLFNTFDGHRYHKTGTPALYKKLREGGGNWGIFEYNPSVPASPQLFYYQSELRALYDYRPHVVVPFAWTDEPSQKVLNIQNTQFEAALKQLIGEIGQTKWSPMGR